MDIWHDSFLQWRPNSIQMGQFQAFYGAVIAANQTLNLTRITSPQDFWEKHLWDSLSGIAPWLGDVTQAPALRGVDIGSGAGFPGIPVAIARPDWSMTLLEATRKKVTFLETLPPILNLKNIQPRWGRAEAYPDSEPRFDLALIRAVGKAPLCVTYGLPLLRSGGHLVLYRGQWTIAEENDLVKQLKQGGAFLEDVRSFQTPLSQSQRHCLLIHKR